MNENTEPQKHIDAARMQLISPPPEEELQRTHVFGFPRTNTNTASAQTKRKRAGVAGGSPSKTSAGAGTTEAVEATPNPKPRKAHRRRTSALESPSRTSFSPASTNPNADYVPPVTLNATHGHGHSRRSVSVTPYEPPPDVFTPPREVLLAPPPSSTRKAKSKSKSKQTEKERTSTPVARARTQTPLRVVVHSVKKEPPPSIDRTRPMTPPSPTDDPLLLLPSSSPVKVNRTRKRSVPVPTPTYEEESEEEDAGVRSSDAAYAPIDWTAGLPLDLDAPDLPTSDSMSMDLDAPIESFDGPLPLTLTLPLSVPLAAAYDPDNTTVYDTNANAGWDSSDDDADLEQDALPVTTAAALGATSSFNSVLSGTPTRVPSRTSTRIRSLPPTTTAATTTTAFDTNTTPVPTLTLNTHTPTPNTAPPALLSPFVQIQTTTSLAQPTPVFATTPSFITTPLNTDTTTTPFSTTATPNTNTPNTRDTPNAGLNINDFLHPTKPDPPTPRTLARAEAWGVWGSPWPGRGPHDGESSFRMDGLGRERNASLRAWGTAPPALFASQEDSVPADQGQHREEEEEAVQEDEQQDEEEEDSADEGVSFLRALREEDARERERLQAGSLSPARSLSLPRASLPLRRLSTPPRLEGGVENEEEEGAGAGAEQLEQGGEEDKEEEDDEEEEEEEVRAMSVDPVDNEDDEHTLTKRGANRPEGAEEDEDEDEEMHSTASRIDARAQSDARFAFPTLATPARQSSTGRQSQGGGGSEVQTPPARRAPHVPARSERVVGRVVERSVVSASAPSTASTSLFAAAASASKASTSASTGGGEGAQDGEDVRMPHHSEQEASASHSIQAGEGQSQGRERDQSREHDEDDPSEEHTTPSARRTTPPILVGVGTHVVVPPSPSPRKKRESLGRRRASFVPVDPEADEDVELPHVDSELRSSVRAEAQEGGEDVEVEAEESGDDPEEEAEAALLGLVKITSADPRAAARAAAILKQHDYDCFTRLRQGKGRRHSYAGVTKSSKTPAAAGGSKTPSPGKGGMQDLVELRAAYDKAKNTKTPAKTRHSMGEKTPARVVGEHVYFPGSPAPVTTAELLAEAEAEISVEVLLSAGPSSARKSMPASPSARARQAMDRETNRRASARVVPLPESDDESASDDEESQGQGREWTKAEWKALDACFTDERIAVARKMGMVLNLSPAPGPSTPVRHSVHLSGSDNAPVVMMASADAVDLNAVVARFVKTVGGEEVIKGWGAAWEMDRLTQYARALQNKQRAGHVAPPTPSAVDKDTTNDVFASERRRASMAVPDFTPLGKRAMPPRANGARAPMSALALSSPSPLGPDSNTSISTATPTPAFASRARLPPPVGVGAPFSNLPPTPEPARRRRVPGSLFAPRYSHLLEEAVAVSRSERGPEEEQEDADGDVSLEGEEQLEEQEEQQEQEQESSFDSSVDSEDAEMVPATPLREREERLDSQHPAPEPSTATIGNRVKGFLFSYLPIPTLAKTAPPPTRKAPLHAGPRLPLPPLELLEKPRGPVTTPARPPLPKTRAPKELVNLNPAPQPKQKSLLPRRAPPPKRLVELQHVEPPVEAPTVPFVPRPRTASGGSVKDLVKNFEAKTASANAPPQVKRVRSVGDFGSNNNNIKRPGTATGGAARPIWRP